MTFREKIAMEHPDKLNPEYSAGVSGCPCNYGYETEINAPCGVYRGYKCDDCWNREIPGSTTPEEAGCMDYKAEYVRIKDAYDALVKRHEEAENFISHLKDEHAESNKTISDLRNEIIRLKGIIRTVEVLTGGKLLDD